MLKCRRHCQFLVDVHFHIYGWTVVLCRHLANADNGAHPADDPANNAELAIQERQLPQCDVKLGSNGVLVKRAKVNTTTTVTTTWSWALCIGSTNFVAWLKNLPRQPSFESIVLAVAAHAQEPWPVMRHMEGLMLQLAASSSLRVFARAIYEVTSLNPAPWLDPVDGMAVELGLREQLDEILRQLWSLVVEKLELNGLLGLVSDSDGKGTIGSASLLLDSLDGLVSHAPIEHEVRVVLVLIGQGSPVQKGLLRGKVHDLVFRLCEDEWRAGLGLGKAPTIVGHKMLKVLFILRLEEAFHSGLHGLLLRRQVVYCSFQQLEGWILDFAIPRLADEPWMSVFLIDYQVQYL